MGWVVTAVSERTETAWSGDARQARWLRVASLVALALLVCAGIAVARLPEAGETLGSYGTSLRERARSQRVNVRRAARALDGVTLAPGETFSFNRRVGPWNAAAGYRKAPVSFDGELMASYGGGVCQTSTTLYNAALIAGLQVVERHRHIRPPTYVAPGRDAAVAMPGIDLRLRNPYPFPVRLKSRVVGESLLVAVTGRGPRRFVDARTEVQTLAAPPAVNGTGARKGGMAGFSSLTVISEQGRGRLLTRDAYPPVSALKP